MTLLFQEGRTGILMGTNGQHGVSIGFCLLLRQAGRQTMPPDPCWQLVKNIFPKNLYLKMNENIFSEKFIEPVFF